MWSPLLSSLLRVVTGELSSAALSRTWLLGCVGISACRGWGRVLGCGEVHADDLVLAALLDLAALGEGALVGSGRRLLDHEREAARPEPPGRDDVPFGGEQGDMGGQVDP